MKKVVGLGACVLDTLINCETYPQEDTKKKANSIFLSGHLPIMLTPFGMVTEVSLSQKVNALSPISVTPS